MLPKNQLYILEYSNKFRSTRMKFVKQTLHQLLIRFSVLSEFFVVRKILVIVFK